MWLESTSSMISIETSGIEYNLNMGTVILKFTGEISIDQICGADVDPYNEENMLMIARELLIQVKMMAALTSD